MKSLRCPSCGLVNFETAAECRRCKRVFGTTVGKHANRTPRRFSLFSIAAIALAGYAVYYLYGNSDRVAGGPPPTAAGPVINTPTPLPVGLTRSEQDRARAKNFKNAVADSPALNEHKKHIEETQKTMQALSNSK